MAIEVKIQRKLNTFELNIDFKSDSKRIGILGASGCGKSMTLKSIAGIEPPESGLIKIEGKTVYDSENKVNLKPQKRNIGYLFQNYALFPTMTVEKNIAAGLKGKKQENAKRVREMIEKFQLTGLEKRFPAELSGGQQQRVALARIMAYKPDVILLDEPFSALDMYLKDRLQQELLELFKDYEGTVIMVSHSRDEVYRFSEELLIIDQGQIVAAMIHPSHVCTTLIPKFSNKKIPNGLLLLKISNRKKPATVGGSTIGKVSIPSIIAFFPGVVFTTLRAA